MSEWLPRDGKHRGRVMGLWSTNAAAGGIGIAVLVTYLNDTGYSWRQEFTFPVPFAMMLGVGVCMMIQTAPERGRSKEDTEQTIALQGNLGQERGNRNGSPDSKGHEADIENMEEVNKEPKLGFLQVLKLPGVFGFGSSYFCLKLMRYTLLFWLPYYYNKAVGERALVYVFGSPSSVASE